MLALRPAIVVFVTWLTLQVAKRFVGDNPMLLHGALMLTFILAATALGQRAPFQSLRRPQGRLGYRLSLGFFIATNLAYILTHPGTWQWSLQDHFHQVFTSSEWLPLVIAVPFYEELFFRGALQPKISQALTSRSERHEGWGIYISALLFWLFHAPLEWASWSAALSQGAVPLSPGPFLLGLVCGVIFLKDGSLLQAMVFHGLANLLGPLWVDVLPVDMVGIFFTR